MYIYNLKSNLVAFHSYNSYGLSVCAVLTSKKLVLTLKNQNDVNEKVGESFYADIFYLSLKTIF